jgi:adenosylcobinamide-GDP ribazoletransferase
MKLVASRRAVVDGRAAEHSAQRDIPRGLLAASAVLTRIPVQGAGDLTGGWAFGIVGATVGVVAAVPLIALASLGAAISAIVTLGVIVVVSGALHLDGLADTADALAAATPDAAERARSDPRSGPAGVVALVIVLGLEWALVTALLERDGSIGAAAALVAALAVSRSIAPLSAVFFGSGGRPGFGRWFAGGTTAADGLVAAATALGLAGLMGLAAARPTVPIAAAVGLLIGVGVAAAVRRVRHGLDGDGFGAIVELTFATTLVAALIGS